MTDLHSLIPGTQATIFVPLKVEIEGETQPIKFSCEFKRHTKEDARELIKSQNDIIEKVKNLAIRLTRWKHLEQEQFKPIADFSDEMQDFIKREVGEFEELGDSAKLELSAEYFTQKINECEAESVALSDRLDQMVRDNVVGWKGFKGKGGSEIKFDPETLDFLLTWSPYSEELLRGLKHANGKKRQEDAAKNLKR